MEPQSPASSHQKTALVVGTCTAFITSFFGSALNLSIPDLGNHFHMGAASVGWIITAYMLIVASCSVPFGKVADSTDRRRVLLTGICVFGLASVCAVFSPNAVFLLILRIVQALGASMIFATNMPIAMSAYPGRERGKVIGIVTTGTYVGLAVGPVLGGILNNHFGWKSIFLFGALVSLFALCVSLRGLEKEKGQQAPVKQDLPGNLLYILMIAALIYGLTVLNSMSFAWVLLAAAVVLGVVFVKWELKTENPVVDVRIFAMDRVYTLSNFTALFNYAATFALGYLTSIYLQVVMGFSSQTAGIILISQPFFMALLSPKMGKLSDHVPPYKLASGGMALCALALLFFVFLRADTPVWAIVLALAVAGVGIALFSSPNTNVIMGCVPPAKFGVANTILATMRTTGQSTGMAIITLVVSATVGNISLYEIPPENLIRTIHTAFTVFTALCILGMLMSLQRRKN